MSALAFNPGVAMEPTQPSLDWVGVGWRPAHQQDLLSQPAGLGFIEVHSENFLVAGSAAQTVLLKAREEVSVSLHGVGLSLGSAMGLDAWHLDRLAELVSRVQPCRVSDHAAFARVALPVDFPRSAPGGPVARQVVHGCDLLPLSFNVASLALMISHVQQVQERLRRPLLVENLSAYLVGDDACFSEPEFFNLLTRHSGCQVLLDVNNLVVNAVNQGAEDPVAQACCWIDTLAVDSVGEIHLAGYCDAPHPGGLAIDDHGSPVRQDVWRVYRHALQRFGPVPSLVEWDTDLPAWAQLLAQARQAAHHVQAEQERRGTLRCST